MAVAQFICQFRQLPPHPVIIFTAKGGSMDEPRLRLPSRPGRTVMTQGQCLLMLTVAGTLGCAATFWAGNRSTTLSLGMSTQQAQALLGAPQQVMSQEAHGMVVETWKYLDRMLVFRNGLLYSMTTQSSSVAPP